MPIDEQQQEDEEVNVTALLSELRKVDRKKRKSEKREKREKQREKREQREVSPYKTGDQVNLRDLLCNETRDYLINNNGYKINVGNLEDKVVALYLYEEGCSDEFTETLKIAYEQLVRVENRMFEVVLVYMYNSWNTHNRTNEETFSKTFSTMPWLALPFKDINSAKSFTCCYRPRGEFVEPFGAATILKNFGIQAYPFTRQISYKLQAERVKAMKLEMLWRPKTVFMGKRVSQEVPVEFSEIVSKRIMVFCDCNSNKFYSKFKMKLLQRYMETRGTDDEFEVIHIGVRDGEDVPWLRPPTHFGPSIAVEALSRILRYGYGILAFDRDGKVIRATSNPRFQTEDCNFPFYAGSIEEEVRIDLINRFKWNDGDRTFLN
ncbi:hypothetical protein OROHE_009357 [Orobanche hederae]